MKLLVSALSGTVAACLIFAMIVMIPLQTGSRVLLGVSVGGGSLLRLEGPEGVAYEATFHPESGCVLNVTLYEFSSPVEVSREAALAISLTSKLNYTEVFYVTAKASSTSDDIEWYKQQLPGTVQFVDGGSEWSWTGGFEANETKTFNHRIKATGVGTAHLDIETRTKIIMNPTPENHTYGESVGFYLKMVPDNVLVISTSLLPELVLDYMVLHYNSSEHLGVGSEFNVSLSLYGENTSNAVINLVLPEGIVLVEGQTTWIKNFTSWNEKVTLSTTKIRFVKVGTWFAYAYAEKDGILLDAPRALKFVVSEDDVWWFEF